MKMMNVQRLTVLAALAAMLALPLSARGDDAAAIFKAKCAGCHGADGTGSAMGKKMGAHDFTSADVQKMPDAELTGIITDGKGKMPSYKSLPPEQVKGLVAYIRMLKK